MASSHNNNNRMHACMLPYNIWNHTQLQIPVENRESVLLKIGWVQCRDRDVCDFVRSSRSSSSVSFKVQYPAPVRVRKFGGRHRQTTTHGAWHPTVPRTRPSNHFRRRSPSWSSLFIGKKNICPPISLSRALVELKIFTRKVKYKL